jgi:hypothetical protein
MIAHVQKMGFEVTSRRDFSEYDRQTLDTRVI